MTTSDIRGLLFDKDGTLFDFSASWSAVIDQTLEALTPDRTVQITMARASGYDPEAGVFAPGSPAVAGSLDEVAEIWGQHLAGTSVGDILRVADEISEAASERGFLVPAVDDLPGFLDGLRGAGYLLGIATHDSEAAARAHVGAFGALDHFDFIAGYDSGHGHKPGPGMLLAFADATGLHPRQIAMVGDSVHDLGVAPSAGAALAIGVLTGPAGHDDLSALADHILPSIAGLPALLQSYRSA